MVSRLKRTTLSNRQERALEKTLQNRTLTYVIQGQAPLVPGPLSINRPRHWVVEGDTLILTTRDEAGNPLSVGRWKRSQ